MRTIQALLEEQLRKAVHGVLEAGDLPVSISPATDPRFGDYQTNIAMLLAKREKTNPRGVAQKIVAAFEGAQLCDSLEIAGAGFINFRVRAEFLGRHFLEISRDPRLGVAETSAPQKIIIDFSAPNIAKPMHVGHIRSTILGDTLARIAKFIGHNVVTDNHLGDWGTQFGKVIYGWKNLLNPSSLKEDPIAELVRLYKEANALSEADPKILQLCRDELVKLQQGDPENLGIWRECVSLSWQEFEQMYALLGISFDERLGESSYNEQLGPLVERLLGQGIAEVSDGAVCVFFRETPALADKPFLIRKTDGGFLYATTDLATLEYRVARWNPDAIWYVVGAPQQLHFEQLFATAHKMGLRAELRHVAFGSILGEDRKLMKTRSGESVGLRDVLNEALERARKSLEEKNPGLSETDKSAISKIIGIGAVKYAELSQFRMTDYVFSWDKMLSMQGNTAPYLQNAYVRIRSIFRKLVGDFVLPEELCLKEAAETALAKKVCQFGEIVPQVLEDARPNILCNYLYELANTFHNFYEACPVLKSQEPVRAARLALCDTTANVLRQGLALLGIEAPEKM